MDPLPIIFAAYVMAFLPTPLALLLRPSLMVSTVCTGITLALLTTVHTLMIKNLKAPGDAGIPSNPDDSLLLVLACVAVVSGALIYHLRRE